MANKFFYEKNTYLLNHEVNKTFEQVLWMSKDEFRQWCVELREVVVYAWDKLGTPPVVGKSEETMIDLMNHMIGYPVNEFVVKDELTGNNDIIHNTQSEMSGVINGFFPTMMKTRINYTKDPDAGRSIYDYFADPILLDTFVTYASRHFKRDSFYAYSNPAKVMDKESVEFLPCTRDAQDWIQTFEKKYRAHGEWDYWIAPKEEAATYTGYNQELKDRKNFFLNEADLFVLQNIIPAKALTNVAGSKHKTYNIRVFKHGQKLFPIGLKAFRVSYCQYATNFPPLTAKYLYGKYTEHCKNNETVVLYDPSAGWGGRLLGALSIDDRNIHYIGTDPNRDHDTVGGRTKYHELADFFNDKTNKGSSLFPHLNSYEIYQLGSEEIAQDKNFQKWKGKVDMVFTSPPYFSKEAYSEDEGQSYKKFGQYDAWKKGFLEPTLWTAFHWLRNDRYLLWNIADVVFSGERLPLEQDSINILTDLGMEYRGVEKMAMSQMPGGNRLVTDENGDIKATTKNICRVNGLYRKYEPVFVFYKP